MSLYVDCYFALNLIMCYMQLYLTKKVYNKKTSFIRLILGAIAGTLYSFVVLFKGFSNLWYIFSALTVSAVFKFDGYKDYLRTLITFYLILFVFGGCAFAFLNIFEVKMFLIATGVSYLILWLFGGFYKKISVKINSIVNVKVALNGKELTFKGLIDTGNSLKDPYTDLPVMIIYNQLNENIRTRLVPYNSVGEDFGLLKVFTPERVTVNEKQVKCAVGIYEKALSGDKTFDAILNPEIIYWGE